MSSEKSLLVPEALQQIMDRINSLAPEQQRLWGTMKLEQMLAHCQKPLEVALGIHALDKGWALRCLSFFLGKTIKKKMLNEEPLAKNSPTTKSFVIHNAGSMNLEREQLKNRIKEFVAKANAGELGDRHPLFGKMTQAEWDLLQWKHLDHHLRQFGA